MHSRSLRPNRTHFAALTLAWLLMFPPQAERSGTPLVGPDLTAPISGWRAMEGEAIGESGAFPTKSACEDYRAKMIADAKARLLVDAPADVEKMPSESATVKWTFGLSAFHSKCIGSTDPRLRPSR